MATRIITIPFAKSLNVSLHATKAFVAGEDRAHDQVYKKASNGTVTHLGDLVAVNKTAKTIDVSVDSSLTKPVVSSGEFIFFGKNRAVNESSLVGYYGKFTFVNDSKDKAELFSVACEIAESSK